MELTKQQNDAIAQLAKKYQLQLVLLFGSLATGKARNESDADVAVLAKGKKIIHSLGYFLDLIEELSSIFKKKPICLCLIPLILSCFIKLASKPNCFLERKKIL